MGQIRDCLTAVDDDPQVPLPVKRALHAIGDVIDPPPKEGETEAAGPNDREGAQS